MTDTNSSNDSARRPRNNRGNNNGDTGDNNSNGRTPVRNTVGGLKTLEIYSNKGGTSNFYDFKKEFVIYVYSRYKECGHTFKDGSKGLYFPPPIKQPTKLKKPTKQKTNLT